MSSEFAIRLRRVSKAFNIYNAPADRLKQMIWRGQRQFYNLFHALHHIDLDVGHGETIGILGRNGSGKSTLLQVIAGTLTPSEGVVEVNGRIAAMLELGTGFNPEFTGRENVYLNASILGLQRAEIDERFDAIAAFADIGEFLERPVKIYSSGMYARLAFAVAINVDPDILIVDEALAVGDEAFQRKCFARIRAIRDAGATILFVSHTVGTITELCDRALLLDSGELLYQGKPKDVVALYQKLIYARPEDEQNAREYARSYIPADAENKQPLVAGTEAKSTFEGDRERKLGSAEQHDESFFDPGLVSRSLVAYEELGARISDVVIKNEAGDRVNVLTRGKKYFYEYNVSFSNDASSVRFTMLIKTLSGVELGAQSSASEGDAGLTVRAGQSYLVRIPFLLPFNPGTYFVNAGVVGKNDIGASIVLHRLIDATMIRVQPVLTNRAERYVSIVADELPSSVLLSSET